MDKFEAKALELEEAQGRRFSRANGQRRNLFWKNSKEREVLTRIVFLRHLSESYKVGKELNLGPVRASAQSRRRAS